MARWAVLSLCLLVLAGCFSPKAQVAVQNWRPMGAVGPTLAEALAASPWHKNVVWEAYAGKDGASQVRLSVEYKPAGPEGLCTKLALGTRRADRIFLLLEFAVSPKAEVTFTGARAQVYTASGYYEEYPLGLEVMAQLMAQGFPLPCVDLDLPAYL